MRCASSASGAQAHAAGADRGDGGAEQTPGRGTRGSAGRNAAGQIQPGRLRPWLGRVVRNKALNRLRALGGELPLEDDMLALTPDGAPGPAELLEQEQRRELVRALLNELSPQDRAIFLRHYYYGQTTAEIGGALSMRPSTVKVRLHRGRKKLKELLSGRGYPCAYADF